MHLVLALEFIELAGERGVGGEESPQAAEGAALTLCFAVRLASRLPQGRVRERALATGIRDRGSGAPGREDGPPGVIRTEWDPYALIVKWRLRRSFVCLEKVS